jgi:hypothetical protein
MSALIGFRIEFYDNPESSGRRLVGAAVKEDAFTVQAVPVKGDYVAVNILAGGTAAGAWWPGNVPFEQVHHLEHYPASVGGDEVPSAQVVIQTAAPGEYQADALVQHFTSEEWQVSSFIDGSPLAEAWRKTI